VLLIRTEPGRIEQAGPVTAGFGVLGCIVIRIRAAWASRTSSTLDWGYKPCMSTNERSPEQVAKALLDVAGSLAVELQPRLDSARHISLDSHLDRDLGLDSLSRLELISRIEKHFTVRLPDNAFSEAETPRDLLRAVLGADAVSETVLDRLSLVPQEGDSKLPEQAETLVEVLDWHVRHHPQQAHIRLYADDAEDQIISYRELRDASLAVAANLQAKGLLSGERVALMLPTGRDYFCSFFGVLYAGGVPVPIYPPTRLAQLGDHMRRQAGILDNAQCRFLITVPEAKSLGRLLGAQLEYLRGVLIADELPNTLAHTMPSLDGGDTAFLQYTSGSTGNPKGVVLTHTNLLSNIRVDGAAIEASNQDVFVSWLHLYHDMGLIGAWLGSLYFGAQLVIMSPLAFLARPVRWLQAIHRYGGTLSAAPNFAYQLCLARIEPRELDGLDLSGWRIAMNGAETVSPDTVEAFIERFSAYGFASEAMFPVYGLAENAVGLAFPPLHRRPRIESIDRELFSREGLANPVPSGQTDALRFVGCGRVLPEHAIRIVDADGNPLADRYQGQLQFRGPSATRGYFRNPEATAALFDGDWLQSGDLAYVANGELFITGRIKDMIIRGGRNIHPQELEEAIGAIAGIRKGRVAVFASRDQANQTEKLVILAETREKDESRRRALRQRINAITTELTQAPADDIVLAPTGAVLKTSSGKIRRAACRQRYEQGGISRTPGGAWMQVAQMLLQAVPMALRRQWKNVRRLAYAIYAQTLFRILAAVVAVGVLLIPGLDWRWVLLRKSALLLGRLTGIHLGVEELQNLPASTQPCIFVANHSSYIDSYVATASIPSNFRFVAKAELADRWLSRTFLQRLDTLFVRRQDRTEGVAGVESSIAAARQGDSLFFFPEGTFTRAPGLRAFRMGAFLAAATSGLPIVPIALRGTRAILPAGTWVARRGAIAVTIAEPLYPDALRRPDEPDWELAVRMKGLARRAILRHCGEADMEHERVFPPTR